MPMATKLDKYVTYFEGVPKIKLHGSLITWSCRVMDKLKPFYPTTLMPMATKLSKMVTYTKTLLPIKYHDHIIT